MNKDRLARILAAMQAKNLSRLIIADPVSIYYLTGEMFHTGERMLALHLSSDGESKLFIQEMFPAANTGAQVIKFSDTEDPVAVLSEHTRPQGAVGVDKVWPARFLLNFMKYNPGCDVVNGSPAVDETRMIKDAGEIRLMREASQANDAAMNLIMRHVGQGISEKQLAKNLADIYQEQKASGFSFDPIIAFGANAADPHHETGDATVKPGDSVLLDIGCVKNGYCSDMTRTAFYKHVPPQAREIYKIVLEANLKAIAAVKPGVRFCDIDAVARGVIEAAGYGQYFTHRTGHSIGLEVHDFGDVSSINRDSLKPGMIFSIEPGIYLPGETGVRIEDLVVVTETGCEVLNNYPKDLKILE